MESGQAPPIPYSKAACLGHHLAGCSLFAWAGGQPLSQTPIPIFRRADDGSIIRPISGRLASDHMAMLHCSPRRRVDLDQLMAEDLRAPIVCRVLRRRPRCSKEDRASQIDPPRHLTPSSGGRAPTAERSLKPARTIGRELDPGSECENSQGRAALSGSTDRKWFSSSVQAYLDL